MGVPRTIITYILTKKRNNLLLLVSSNASNVPSTRPIQQLIAAICKVTIRPCSNTGKYSIIKLISMIIKDSISFLYHQAYHHSACDLVLLGCNHAIPDNVLIRQKHCFLLYQELALRKNCFYHIFQNMASLDEARLQKHPLCHFLMPTYHHSLLQKKGE